ncbi:MAG: ABC transporter permease [Dehalobacterium sp.]
MNALRLEFYKARRKHYWLIVAAMTGTQAMWLIWAMRSMDTRDLAQGYLNCLYQFPILNSIVLPVMIAVLVSRMCDIEHKGGALKMLFTMQPPSTLFTAKFLCAGIHLAGAVGFQTAVILLMGHAMGFSSAPPAADFVMYFASQLLCSLFLELFLQILALRYINQFIPLVAGLITGFLGLMAMFFPAWVMRLVPSAYYGLLSTVHMDWDRATGIVTYYQITFPIADCALLTAALAILYWFGHKNFAKKEV